MQLEEIICDSDEEDEESVNQRSSSDVVIRNREQSPSPRRNNLDQSEMIQLHGNSASIKEMSSISPSLSKSILVLTFRGGSEIRIEEELNVLCPINEIQFQERQKLKDFTIAEAQERVYLI